MSRFLSRLAALVSVTLLLAGAAPAFADTVFSPTDHESQLNLNDGMASGQSRQSYADDSFMHDIEGGMSSTFGNTFAYFQTDYTGNKGAFGLLLNVARDLKNVAFFLVITYLVLSALRLLFSGGSEEGIKKWKNTLIYSTLGLVVMQSAFVAVDTLYDQNVTGSTAMLFLDKLVYPFVHLVEILASFAFLAMAFFAFFRIVTAGGNEEAVKSGKRTIVSGLVGFLVIKLPGAFVKSIYGQASCDKPLIFSVCRIDDPNLSGTVAIMASVVNYIDGFLALVVVLLIVYAGFLVLTGAGNEENVKKAKKMLVYILIGSLLLVSSYVLFNFFVLKDH